MKRILLFILALTLIGCNKPPSQSNVQSNAIKMIDNSAILTRIDSKTVITQEMIDKRSYYVHIVKNRYYAMKNDNTEKYLINVNAYLFRDNDSDNWVYFTSTDFAQYGWINIFEYDTKNYYGDRTKNEESGNCYLMNLNIEYDKLIKKENIRRYGPLLIIQSHGKEYRIWDDFKGEVHSTYNQYIDSVADEYIIIRRQYYEGNTYILYNLINGKEETATENLPIFNKSLTTFFSFGYVSGDAIILEIYSRNGQCFSKDADIQLSEYGDYVEAQCKWISNDSFELLFKNGKKLLYLKEKDWIGKEI